MPSLLALIALALIALAPPAAARGSGWRWPVDGPVVTQYRNGEDPYAGGQHRGIDVSAAAGTPVVAATDGDVRFAGPLGSSGLTVSIRTADGSYDTSYLHLGSIEVRAGDRVGVGARIGSVGTTGSRTLSEPHLHFGVREAGDRFAYRDPLTLLPPPPSGPRVPTPRPLPLPGPAPAPPLLGPPAAAVAAAAAPAPPLPIPSPGPVAAPAPLPIPSPGPVAAPAPLHITHAASPPQSTPHRAGSSRGLPSPHSAAAASPIDSAPTRLRAAANPGRAGLSNTAQGARGSDRATHGPQTAATRAVTSGPASAPPNPPHRTAHAAAAPPRAARREETGLDLGWLAACAGLVAVAALLARPRGPAESLRRGTRLADRTRPRARAAAAGGGADSIATWPTTSPRRSTT
jgi:hypothetical protein